MPDEEKKDEEYTIIPDRPSGRPPSAKVMAIPLDAILHASIGPCTVADCLRKNFKSTQGIKGFLDYMGAEGCQILSSYFLTAHVRGPGCTGTLREGENLEDIQRKMNEYAAAVIHPAIFDFAPKHMGGKERTEVLALIFTMLAFTLSSEWIDTREAPPHA
jgi:hypothetical protein